MTSFPTRQIARLGGHNGQVLAVTYSSGSGQYILTGSNDRAIRLFNPLTPQRGAIQTFSAHGHEVLDIAVSSDNAQLASGGGDKAVFLWDVASARTTRRFAGHAGRVNAVRFCGADEALVASASYDGSVKIWDTKQRADSRPLMTLAEAGDSVSALDVRGEEVLAAGVDGTVRCYDFRMGEVDADRLGRPATSVQWAKAGDSYLVGTLDSKVRLMDRRDGKCLQTFVAPEGVTNERYRIRSCFAAADSKVLSGAEDGSVFVWDVLTGKLEHKLRHAQRRLTDGGEMEPKESSKKDVVSAVAWNQLRKEWATAGGEGTVVVWGAA